MFTGIPDGFLRGPPVEGNGVSAKGDYQRHEVDVRNLTGPVRLKLLSSSHREC